MIFCAENARRYVVYTYGFRDYYATIGRFTSIDPIAEGTYYSSPYAYANNNPIGNIDWMGLFASGGTKTSYYDPPDLSDWLGEGDVTGIGDIIKNIEDLLDKLTGGKGQGSLGGTLGGGGSKTITANVPVTISIGGKAITVMVQTEMQVGFDIPVLGYWTRRGAERENRRNGGTGKVLRNPKGKGNGKWYIQTGSIDYDGSVVVTADYDKLRPYMDCPRPLTEYGQSAFDVKTRWFFGLLHHHIFRGRSEQDINHAMEKVIVPCVAGVYSAIPGISQFDAGMTILTGQDMYGNKAVDIVDYPFAVGGLKSIKGLPIISGIWTAISTYNTYYGE